MSELVFLSVFVSVSHAVTLHFQSVGPTWISSNKIVDFRVLKRECWDYNDIKLVMVIMHLN